MKRTLDISYEHYASIDELDKLDRDLVEEAQEATKTANQ